MTEPPSSGDRDTTPPRHLDLDLETGDELFRGLVESSPDAMVIVDESGVIALVNERVEELFGYRREELVGQPVELLLPDALRHRHAAHRAQFMADARARPMGEGMDLLARRKDGTEFVADISLSPLRTNRGLLISAAVRDISQQLLRQLEQALVPRMRISARWQVAWRYRPAVSSMLLGGDFIGVCERSDGSLSLLIGDVVGHGAAAAGTGAMLRAAWLGAVQGDVEVAAIPLLLHRLLINQAHPATMATACLAEVDPQGHQLHLIRAGHDSPLLITPTAVAAVNHQHGPVLGLGPSGQWPVQRVRLPSDAAIMLFTDGLTERRATRSSPRRFDALGPQINGRALLARPPGEAIDDLLRRRFPEGTDHLEDDVAIILLNLRRSAVEDNGRQELLPNVA